MGVSLRILASHNALRDVTIQKWLSGRLQYAQPRKIASIVKQKQITYVYVPIFSVHLLNEKKMVIVLIVGVCGCGKTTVGETLARRLSCPFEDADNFHSATNISKMKQGIPLTDEDRLPWLMSLHKVVQKWQSNSGSGVLACSALKQSYRQIILHGTYSFVCSDVNQINQDHMVVSLEGSKQVILERMAKRNNHFMPSTLLDSQLEIFEQSESSSHSLRIDIKKSIEEITNEIIKCINDISK